MPKPRTPQRQCAMCGSPESTRSQLIEDPSGQPLCQRCVQSAQEFFTLMNQVFESPSPRSDDTSEGLPPMGLLNELDEDELDEDDFAEQDGEAPTGKASTHRKGQTAKAGARRGQRAAGKPRTPALKVPKPRDIKTFLDLYVVGQEATKRMLAVAVHNHYKRVVCEQQGLPGEFDDVELEKSNILMIGPTGCGKTLMARTLARMLDVPFAIADATTLTEAGYVGEDVENILLNLLQAADMDIERAQVGIIFVDEIDKVGRKTENVSITRDVSGEGVQQALLKIVEGTVARVPPGGGRKHPQQQYIELATKHILFICGGAFVGLDQIVNRRAAARHLGFGIGEEAGGGGKRSVPRVEPEDLIHYGLIPEFVGRLPVLTVLETLSEDDLVRILTEPRNCLVRQYQKLFSMENLKLEFDEKSLRLMARESLTRKTGARGLRAILEELMVDVMFDPEAFAGKDRTLRITETMVREQLQRAGALAELLQSA